MSNESHPEPVTTRKSPSREVYADDDKSKHSIDSWSTQLKLTQRDQNIARQYLEDILQTCPKSDAQVIIKICIANLVELDIPQAFIIRVTLSPFIDDASAKTNQLWQNLISAGCEVISNDKNKVSHKQSPTDVKDDADKQNNRERKEKTDEGQRYTETQRNDDHDSGRLNSWRKNRSDGKRELYDDAVSSDEERHRSRRYRDARSISPDSHERRRGRHRRSRYEYDPDDREHGRRRKRHRRRSRSRSFSRSRSPRRTSSEEKAREIRRAERRARRREREQMLEEERERRRERRRDRKRSKRDDTYYDEKESKDPRNEGEPDDHDKYSRRAKESKNDIDKDDRDNYGRKNKEGRNDTDIDDRDKYARKSRGHERNLREDELSAGPERQSSRPDDTHTRARTGDRDYYDEPHPRRRHEDRYGRRRDDRQTVDRSRRSGHEDRIMTPRGKEEMDNLSPRAMEVNEATPSGRDRDGYRKDLPNNGYRSRKFGPDGQERDERYMADDQDDGRRDRSEKFDLRRTLQSKSRGKVEGNEADQLERRRRYSDDNEVINDSKHLEDRNAKDSEKNPSAIKAAPSHKRNDAGSSSNALKLEQLRSRVRASINKASDN